MTRRHSYDEYSLGNGYAYSMVYRHIFRIFYIIVYRYVYVSAIYGTNHIIFPVFNICFSFFKKSRFFHPWLQCGDRRIDRLSRKKSFIRLTCKNTKKFSLSSFLKGWISLIFFLMWLHFAMKWNFCKRENPDCLRWLTGIVDMIPPILFQRCKFYRSCNRILLYDKT